METTSGGPQERESETRISGEGGRGERGESEVNQIKRAMVDVHSFQYSGSPLSGNMGLQLDSPDLPEKCLYIPLGTDQLLTMDVTKLLLIR